MSAQDESNFTDFTPSSTPHRLATASASATLHRRRPGISTGLQRLDAWLQDGGLPRGKVTEIYGPPGVGKTTEGLQATANALRGGGSSVIWLDAVHRLVGSRLRDVLEDSGTPEDMLERFHHFYTPTLPHLLALLAHLSSSSSSSSFPPADTVLVVVDSVSSLFTTAFPKVLEAYDGKQAPVRRGEALQWAAGRRWSIAGDVMSALVRLAATRGMAVLVLNQTSTRIDSGQGAVLRPALHAKAWVDGLHARIVMFRDRLRQSSGRTCRSEGRTTARFAALVKLVGIDYGIAERVVPFAVRRNGGLQQVGPPTAEEPATTSGLTPVLKRKRDEIADSESADDDDDDLELGADLVRAEEEEEGKKTAADPRDLPSPAERRPGEVEGCGVRKDNVDAV